MAATKKSSRRKTTSRKATARKSTARGRKTASRGTSASSRKSSGEKSSRRKYSPKASREVGTEMHEMKRGKLRSGRSGKKVTSRKQAIAIGLSKARREGAKVPRKKAA